MSLPLTLPGAGAGVTYEGLKSKYGGFSFPQAEIELGGKAFADKQKKMIVDDVNIELTSGFEASIARFKIYNVYDRESGKFEFSDIKSQVVLGNSLKISLGYLGALEPVFIGFVASVSFGFDPADLPYVEVTGMDVKGIMMSGNYAMQLKASSYGDAVKEIFERTAYDRMLSSQAIAAIAVSDTPDKKPSGTPGAGSANKASAATIEMMSESDYEFVVKAAKKFGFEFFTDCGTVVFRKAKSNTETLISLGAGKGLLKFDIAYSLTGMVETIEARSMDAGTGKVITSKIKYSGNLSTSSKAKKLVSKSRRIYIDPSIATQADADARARSLIEDMSYRLGSLECECPGMPELAPGRFVEIDGLGTPVDNKFYITNVIHDFSADAGYKTRLSGRASEVRK